MTLGICEQRTLTAEYSGGSSNDKSDSVTDRTLSGDLAHEQR